MGDDYIVHWIVKIIATSGVAWHEREEICDNLTTAERCFTQLKKDPSILEVRIIWGDVEIKNYRRSML